MSGRAWAFGLLILGLCAPARADRDILADEYLDKLHGMWLGEILGNYAGRPTEGGYCIPRGNPAEDIDWEGFIHTGPWVGDDDTCFEYMYMRLLSDHIDPTNQQIKDAWVSHVPMPSFYIANRQARWLMGYGFTPPETGNIRRNMHSYAIDSQITTEAVGSATPGLRQRSAELSGRLGSVTNDGYAVHAAQFYAAMYAAAAFESDVPTLIQKGLEVVPQSSRTRRVVQDVVAWHALDMADGEPDWRATHEILYDHYVGDSSYGRYHNWLESTVNAGLTTLALLYGQGDFKETVRIGVLAGFDCDCNPATAGGLIGLIRGYSGLPAELTSQASDAYHVAVLQNIVTETTVSQVAADWQALAESHILAAGGSIDGSGAGRTYHLPDADEVIPPPELPDPAGPKGLVADVLDDGGAVTTTASIASHNPNRDRENLDAIIDGICDVRHNGHLPYRTYDGCNSQPAGGDYYQLDFDREVTFASVVFYEGDILWSGLSGGINFDPRVVEPRGGYFLDLTVEVGVGGVFEAVAGLQFSEPLDPYECFQQIELSFIPVVGDSIRIRGPAGGTCEFTSIVELEAYGLYPAIVPGDATGEGQVNGADYTIWADHYLTAGVSPFTQGGWSVGNFNQDTTVDGADYTLWADHYDPPVGAAPEPLAAGLLAAGALTLLRRRTRYAAGLPVDGPEPLVGDHQVPRAVGVDRLGADEVRLVVGQHALEHFVQPDVDGAELLGQVRHHGQVFRQQLQHLGPPAMRIGRPAHVERLQEDHPGRGPLGRPLKALGIRLAIQLRRDGLGGVAQRAVQVVDAHQHAEPVGPVAEHVVVPALAQAGGHVAADALVDERDLSLGIPGREKAHDQADVAVAQRGVGGPPPAVGDAVADEYNGLAVLNGQLAVTSRHHKSPRW